jgi:hypothetical protein
LTKWISAKVFFNFIYSRYFIDALNDPKDFLHIVFNILDHGKDVYEDISSVDIFKKIKQGGLPNVYAQITRINELRDAPVNSENWSSLLNSCGFNSYAHGTDISGLQKCGREEYVFATR